MKRFIFPVVVFLTGAAVLVIEVVALRILAPYFGNTIYSVSSVVSIVLAALSAGYYTGGRLSDKKPSHRLFFSIILAGGVAVVAMQVLTFFVLPLIGYRLPLRTGPLVAAAILFFTPSFLLGMLSPFAITLQKQVVPDEGVGTVSGTIFLWSTLGSIAGSLSTGFILIPHFGTDMIVVFTGGALVLLGGAPLLVLYRSGKGIIKLLIILAVTACAATIIALSTPKNRVLYERDGLYQKTFVYDTIFKNQPVRFMQLDRWVEGGMYLNSDEHVFPYTQYFQLYKLFNSVPQRALVIGGASYTIPKAYFNAEEQLLVDVVEVEPSYPQLAEKFFNAPVSPRLRSHISDGRRFLHESKNAYDVIYSDVYGSIISVPAHFTTREFFLTAKSKLTSDGIFIANIIGSLRHDGESLMLSEIKTFRSVFPESYFFAVNSPDSFDIQNIIFVGTSRDVIGAPVSERISSTDDTFLRSLSNQLILIDDMDLSKYALLTDNYAPIEYLTSKMIR